ncbi:MAG: glucosaminidase domain-containing protein [Thermodesulfobacteriota bacterium]
MPTSSGCLTGDLCPKNMFFGNLEVDRLNVQALLAVTITVIIGMISTLLIFKNNSSFPANIYADNATLLRVSTGEEMIGLLKENDLWQINEKGQVSPLLFASYPDNIEAFATSIKKKVFFHGLLPVALTALDEIRNEKMALRAILAKFPKENQQLIFFDDYGAWGRVLTMDEIEFIMMLTRKYRTNSATEMVSRVDLVPLSMIMAQGAIESSWATSRFANEGNNLFGIWTWSGKGLVPRDRDDGKGHKVAMYDSILDSIRAYILTLNRLPAYRHFREIRKRTMNPLKLADGLLNYSERRDVYVWELKNFIQYNDLRQYDKCFLVDKPIQYKDIKVLKFTQRDGGIEVG